MHLTANKSIKPALLQPAAQHSYSEHFSKLLYNWLPDVLIAQGSFEERFRLPLFLRSSIAENLQARLSFRFGVDIPNKETL